MKNYIVALAFSSIAFISSANTIQQGNQHPRPDPKAQTDKMAQDLGLSEDQKTKVLAINTDASQKMDALRSSGGDKDSMRDARKKLEDEKAAKLKEVLTPDQFQKFQQMREQMRQNMGQGNHQHSN